MELRRNLVPQYKFWNNYGSNNNNNNEGAHEIKKERQGETQMITTFNVIEIYLVLTPHLNAMYFFIVFSINIVFPSFYKQIVVHKNTWCWRWIAKSKPHLICHTCLSEHAMLHRFEHGIEALAQHQITWAPRGKKVREMCTFLRSRWSQVTGEIYGRGAMTHNIHCTCILWAPGLHNIWKLL